MIVKFNQYKINEMSSSNFKSEEELDKIRKEKEQEEHIIMKKQEKEKNREKRRIRREQKEKGINDPRKEQKERTEQLRKYAREINKEINPEILNRRSIEDRKLRKIEKERKEFQDDKYPNKEKLSKWLVSKGIPENLIEIIINDKLNDYKLSDLLIKNNISDHLIKLIIQNRQLVRREEDKDDNLLKKKSDEDREFVKQNKEWVEKYQSYIEDNPVSSYDTNIPFEDDNKRDKFKNLVKKK